LETIEFDPLLTLEVIRHKEGGAIMRFGLPTSNPPLTSASVMGYDLEVCPTACSSENYEGTITNIGPRDLHSGVAFPIETGGCVKHLIV
jgi:hypothetical protein